MDAPAHKKGALGVKITILQIPHARREGGWKHRKELKNDPILMDNDYDKWINSKLCLRPAWS